MPSESTYFALDCFHRLGLILQYVIVAQKMKKSVNNEMGKMILERFALLVCFAGNGLMREDNVTKHRA